MTILAFYPVDNDLGWDRCPSEILCLEQDMAFKKMWKERDGLDARFYDMSHKDYGDSLGQYGIKNADEFEDDYNNEDYDGGFWVQVFVVDRAFVEEVVSYGEQ